MMKKMRFVILNDTSKKMDFQIEPECWQFTLDVGEAATVIAEFQETLVTLQLADDPSGGVSCAVIPGDGDLIVEKDGKNILKV